MSKRIVNRSDIRRAMDQCLPHLEDRPDFDCVVLRRIRGTRTARKKWSVGIVAAIILVLAAATALAVVLLSSQDIVEQIAIPLAQSNDNNNKINENYSEKDVEQIVRIAKENDITIPQELLNILEGNRGYPEEEVIMSLACNAFGGSYSYWTLEQKHWFGEMMILIGFRDRNPDCLPQGDDLTYEQVFKIIRQKIIVEYGDDIENQAMWDCLVDYKSLNDDEGNILPPRWFFEFKPTILQRNGYNAIVESTGEIVELNIQPTYAPESHVGEILEHYESVYGYYMDWNYEIWAKFGKDIQGHDPGSNKGWAFQHAGYRLPPEGCITDKQAQDLALKEVNLEYTTVSHPVCCTVEGTPIWKINTYTLYPQDMGTGQYTAIWSLEIDCMTGAIRDKFQFIVGSATSYLTMWVPRSVYENLPPIPPR